MVNDAKNLFLAGVGAAALTYDKASDVISQLVERGKLTIEDGRELSEELKRDVKTRANETKDVVVEKMGSVKPLTKEELRSVLDEMNYVTKAELLQLKRAIEKLEEKIT